MECQPEQRFFMKDLSNLTKLCPGWDSRAAHPWVVDGPSQPLIKETLEAKTKTQTGMILHATAVKIHN